MKFSISKYCVIVSILLLSLNSFSISCVDYSSSGFAFNLIYSTYFGGNGEDGVGPIILDTNRNVLLIAKTASTDFPIINAIQPTKGGLDDVVLFKLNENGDELLFSTFFGGSGNEYAYGADQDSLGNIVFAGITESSNFPLKNAMFNNRSTSVRDIFITKMSGDGQSILFSTYFFSSSLYMVDIVIDANDNIIIFGSTDGNRFIATNSSNSIVNGSTDFFLTKLSPDGQTIISSILFGGSGEETAQRIDLDSDNNPIFVGYTSSSDYPLIKPIVTNFGISSNGIVLTKFDYTTNSTIFSSFFGGINQWGLLRVRTDHEDNIIIAGSTNNQNFPLINAEFNKSKGITDGFVAKINGTNFTISFSTFITGNGQDSIMDLVIRQNNDIFIVGSSDSSDLPLINEFQTNLNSWDGYFALLSQDGKILSSSYLGGSGNDYIYSIAYDQSNSIVTFFGHTSSNNFPLLNPIQSNYKGGAFDMFITKFNGSNNNLISTNPSESSTTSSMDDTNLSTSTSKNVSFAGGVSLVLVITFIIYSRKKRN